MYGIRYIVLACGGPEDPATDQDVDEFNNLIRHALEDVLGSMVPVTTVLSERVSNKLTIALLQEKGVI